MPCLNSCICDVTHGDHGLVQPSLTAHPIMLPDMLEAALNCAPDAVIASDEQGVIAFFSDTTQQLLGYSSGEMIGQSLHHWLPNWQKVIADGTEALTACIIAAKDGSDRPVDVHIRRLAFDGQKLILSYLRCTKEKLETEARCTALHDKLLHASRISTFGEVGSGLAHELNQPLAAAANFLGAAQIGLEGAQDTHSTQHLIDLANQQVARAGSIIRRMRSFMATGERDLQRFTIDELVENALELTMPRAREAGIQIAYHSQASQLMVLVDQIPIEQVLVNIINNSLDILAVTLAPSPAIDITTIDMGDGHVRIQIEDNGPGFSDAMIHSAAAPFSFSQTNGLGIGLSICRRVVEGHSSHLQFRNRPEGGAHIAFTLPVDGAVEDRGSPEQGTPHPCVG